MERKEEICMCDYCNGVLLEKSYKEHKGYLIPDDFCMCGGATGFKEVSEEEYNEYYKISNEGSSIRMSWDTFFFEMVELTSKRSPCERLQVGAVIVNKENRVLSTGYNGYPSGYRHVSNVVDNHEQNTIHAEINAICFAAKQGVSLEGSRIYITHYPCINCVKSILASGIKEIYYIHDYKNDPNVKKLLELSENEKIKLFNKKELHE